MLYIIDTMKGSFENIKAMMEDTMKVKKGRWYTSIEKYMENLGISWEELKEMSREELKLRVKEYDTKKWKTSLQDMKTQKYYVQGKKKFGYDFCYRNSYDSTFLAKARLNALKLEEQIGRGKKGYDTTCKMCKSTKEDIVHFIMDCPALEEVRDYDLMKDTNESSQERMIDLLFRTDRYQEVGCMIRKLWQKRRKLLEYIKEKEEIKEKSMKDKSGKPHSPAIFLNSDPGPVRGVMSILEGDLYRNQGSVCENLGT